MFDSIELLDAYTTGLLEFLYALQARQIKSFSIPASQSGISTCPAAKPIFLYKRELQFILMISERIATLMTKRLITFSAGVAGNQLINMARLCENHTMREMWPHLSMLSIM